MYANLFLMPGQAGFWGGSEVFKTVFEVLLFGFWILYPWYIFFWVAIEKDWTSHLNGRKLLFLGLLIIVINIYYLYCNLYYQYPAIMNGVSAANRNQTPCGTEVSSEEPHTYHNSIGYLRMCFFGTILVSRGVKFFWYYCRRIHVTVFIT